MVAASIPRRTVLAAGCAFATNAYASVSSRPIKIIVPSVAGSSSDVLVRLIGSGLSQLLGQSVRIYNKGGAGGNIGMQVLLNAVPDGYTLGYGNNASLICKELLIKQLPYDPRGLVPVGGIARTSSLLLVHGPIPVHTVSELVIYIKSSGEPILYGSGGIGTTSHLGAELFKAQMGLQTAEHISYMGSPQALKDLMAGRLHYYFENIVTAAPHLQNDKLRVLAVTSPARSPQYPELPTMQEAGVAGFVMQAWGGLLLPPGAPVDVVRSLNRVLNRVLQTPKIKAQLERMAFTPLPGSPEDFKAMVDAERLQWRAVVKASGASVE